MNNEEIAKNFGNDKKLLAERFRETLSVLLPWARNMFPKRFSMYRLDMKNKRYLGDGCYLQWKLREYPDLPVSYNNQQTSRGRVDFVNGDSL